MSRSKDIDIQSQSFSYAIASLPVNINGKFLQTAANIRATICALPFMAHKTSTFKWQYL